MPARVVNVFYNDYVDELFVVVKTPFAVNRCFHHAPVIPAEIYSYRVSAYLFVCIFFVETGHAFTHIERTFWFDTSFDELDRFFHVDAGLGDCQIIMTQGALGFTQVRAGG